MRYRFASEDTDDFRLDPNSGRLYLQKKLFRKSYELAIEALDGGGLVSERQVHWKFCKKDAYIQKSGKKLANFEFIHRMTLEKIEVIFPKFPAF